MKNILLVCYGGGHAAMLVPVLKEIQKKESCRLTVLALTTACSVMESQGIEFVNYKDFGRLADTSYVEIGKSLAGYESASAAIPYGESVAYYGINFLDLVEQHGEDVAKEMYQDSGRQGFYPINFMKRVLAELDVDLLVATNSPRSERAAIDAAGQLGIKSLCLIDLFALQAVKWIGKQGYGSKLCVLNSSVKNMFINAGRSEQEVVITGNPAFDSLTATGTIAQGKALKESCGWDASPLITILYASQVEPEKHPFDELFGDPELPRKIEQNLRDFVKKDKRFRLVLRYHPSENVEFKPQERVVFSTRDENLHVLLHTVDIVIVTASTVGLEGHLIGKPVISIDNSIFTQDAPYSRMGISSGIPNLGMLAEKIISVSNNLSVTTIKAERLDATSNVLAVIDQLLVND